MVSAQVFVRMEWTLCDRGRLTGPAPTSRTGSRGGGRVRVARRGNYREPSSSHVAFRDRPFHGGTLLPEGEQKKSSSRRGDFGKPHRGQLPNSDKPIRWGLVPGISGRIRS